MDLNEYELGIFKEAYDILDVDGDHNVTMKELRMFVNKMGQTVTDQELSNLMYMMDIDGIGSIMPSSFTRTLINIMSTPQSEDILRETFQIYDKDRSGYITVDNLRNTFIQMDQLLPTEELEQMIRQYDNDGDGCLSYEEFVSMMTH